MVGGGGVEHTKNDEKKRRGLNLIIWIYCKAHQFPKSYRSTVTIAMRNANRAFDLKLATYSCIRNCK